VEDLGEIGVRSYVPEPARGRHRWKGTRERQRAVYTNRRRTRGRRGLDLQRRRGQLLERSFAHFYDTGGMRRIHLRGHPKILKTLLIHAAGYNFGLVMRKLWGAGTPRGLAEVVCGLSHALGVGTEALLGPWDLFRHFRGHALSLAVCPLRLGAVRAPRLQTTLSSTGR